MQRVSKSNRRNSITSVASIGSGQSVVGNSSRKLLGATGPAPSTLLFAATACAVAGLTGTAWAQNVPDNVITGATAPLDTASNYSLNQLPGSTNDMVFTSGTYTTTAFTLNTTPLTPGTLDDLDATQALTITGSQSITLNGGLNSTTGSAAADLIYVATGGKLSTSTTPIVLTIAPASGNFDVSGTGTLTIGGVISGSTFGFNKTGSGTLTLSSAASTFSGGVILDAGEMVLGAASSGAVGAVTSGSLGTGTVTLGGGTLASSVNSAGAGISIYNAVNVAASTSTILTNAGTNGDINFLGAVTGTGTIVNATSGVSTASTVTFGGDLSGFDGTFSYQNVGSLVAYRFGPAAGGSSFTVNASNAAFVINDSSGAAGLRNVALPNSSSAATFEIGSLSGSGILEGSYYGSGSGTVDNYVIGSLGTSTIFSGYLADTSSNNQGNFNLIKVGAGSLTLSNTASKFTGSTTIEQGSLIAGANVPSGAAGPFGNSTAAIALGDANTISNTLSPSLLIAGGFTVARQITVGASTGSPTGGTYTLGGSTDNNAIFSGAISLNQSLTVSQVANAGTNALQISGAISDNNPNVPTVTFSGPGNIELSAVNSYTGATTVTAGVLALTGSGAINTSSSITVNGAGAKFLANNTTAVSPTVTLTLGTVDGTGTINTLNVANSASNVITNGGIILNGALNFSPLTVGSLTFNGAATLNLRDNGTTPGLNVTTLTTTAANGFITVNAADSAAWSVGTYDLASIGSTNDTGTSFRLGTVTGLSLAGSATLSDTATASSSGYLVLNIVSTGDNPKWTGLDNGNWVAGSTGSNDNWKYITAGTPTNYSNGEAVLFDNTATGTTSVSVSAANVSPSSTTFNNSTKSYSLSGPYGIAGSGGLTVTGGGSVTINNTNSYTGLTTSQPSRCCSRVGRFADDSGRCQLRSTPRIDASADDPAWTSAVKIGGLSMCVGPQAKGIEPTPTEILVMWDEKFLYVRFCCVDSDIFVPHGTERNAMHSEGDVAEVFLDPVGDSRQFFELQINPVGGLTTGTHLITADPVSGPDGVLNNDVIARNAWFILGWEMKGLQSAAAITTVDGKPGWIADLAIPAQPLLKRTGLRKLEPMTLRGNFLRYDEDQPTDAKHKQKSIFMNWSPVVWGRPHRSPATMGTLVLQRPGEQR